MGACCAATSTFKALKSFLPPSLRGGVATRSFWLVGKFQPLARQAAAVPNPAKATRAEAIATAETNLLRIRPPESRQHTINCAIAMLCPNNRTRLAADYVVQWGESRA